MNDSAPAFSGIVGTVRHLFDSVVCAAHDRLELIGVELQEEKLRLISLLVWICAAAFAGMMSIVFLSLTIVYFCPPSARGDVLIGLTAAYGVAALCIIVALKGRIERAPQVFAATLDELEKDKAGLEWHNGRH